MKIVDVHAHVLEARQVEALDIGWFEEPVLPEDVEGHRAVEAAVRIPIASGECVLEFDRTEHPIRAALLTRPIEHRDGRVAVPTGARLGIEIDRAALARFRMTD
jgi:L-alanine-DL-glutamate epimerase-like enolase superfamily enzyme